jgi:hypothetical protein
LTGTGSCSSSPRRARCGRPIIGSTGTLSGGIGTPADAGSTVTVEEAQSVLPAQFVMSFVMWIRSIGSSCRMYLPVHSRIAMPDGNGLAGTQQYKRYD